MNNSGKKRLGIFLSIGAVLCIVIGLMFFLLSDKPVPGESVQSQKAALSQSISVEPEPQALPADTKAVKQPVEETVEGRSISGEQESQSKSHVFGVVKNQKGEPVGGALVHAVQVDSGARHYDASTTTAEDGTYELKGLHAGNPFLYKIIAEAPGYAATSSPAFALDGPSKELNVTLLKGVSLTGRVITFDGKLVKGATLSLMESSRVTAGWLHFYSDYDGVLTATAGADDRYSFANVLPGEYWLYVRAPKYYDEEKLFAISPDDDGVTMDFMMHYAGEEFVAGIVVDEESGQPIESARVECRAGTIQESEHRSVRRTCYTSAEGTFFVDGFHDSYPSIRVSKRGCSRKDVQIHGRNRNELDMHDLKIPLKSWGDFDGSPTTVSGRVFDSASNEALSEFKIAILREDEEVYFVSDKRYYCDYSHAFRSPDGNFLIPEIASGRVSLMVSASGYATRRVPIFVYPKTVSEKMRQLLRESGREDDLKNFAEIGLEQGATASGAIHGFHTKAPVPGVRVNLDNDWRRPGIGPITLSAFTDELGRYRLEGIPEGSHWLIASRLGYAPALSREIQFSRGEERGGLDFLLGPGGSIEGRILDNYKKQDGVVITFQSIDSPVLLKKVRGHAFENRFLGPSRIAQTDAQGRYRVDGLTPGYCYVRTQFWSTDGDRGWDVQVNEVVEVAEGKTTVFDIPACGGTVEGIIYFDESFRSDPKKQEGYYVWLREANAPPLDLSGEGDQIIRAPIRTDMNRRSRDYWGFRFEGICAGQYTVTILRYERHGGTIVDQKSASTSVREYGVAEVKIDMRKKGLAGWKNYGAKLIESLKGAGSSDSN